MKKILEENNVDILRQNFLAIKTFPDLAKVLEVKVGHLFYWLNVQKNEEKYTQFTIQKKNGKERKIYAPKKFLKILQRKLNKILMCFYDTKAPVHGFVKNKSIITNANYHYGKKLILNIDLNDFFPTINKGRVFGIFRNKPFEFSILISKILANLCCYQGIIPQGAPTSPILSNFVCRKLDNELTKIAKVFHCSYSRYADDITFSTNQKEFPLEIAEIIYDDETQKIKHSVGKAVKNTLIRNGFNINEAKTRILSRNNRQSVTGLIINEKLNIPRNYIKNTKSMLFNWEINKKKNKGDMSADIILKDALDYHLNKNHNKNYKNKSSKVNFKNILRGRINFIKNVRGENDFVYAKLMNKFNLLAENQKPHIPINFQEVIKENLWILEDENQTTQSTAFLLRGVGFVTCYHCLYDSSNKLINNMKAFQNANITYDIKVLKQSKHLDLAVFELLNYDIDIDTNGFLIGDSSKISLRSKLTLAGFPERGIEFEPDIRDMKVTRKKIISSIEQICVDTPIIKGHSGGPVFNDRIEVIGVAARGSSFKNSDETTNNAYITIEMLKKI